MTASVEPAWWVVTDLDGTLLDHSYDWSPAKDLIRELQQHRIPVIPCTSKTAEEVRGFRAEAGLHDPYIVENGGAVHGETPAGEPWELPLGPDWTALKPQLQRLQAELGEPLRPLDELSEEEGQRLLGLGGEALRQAQRRCCSVPFVPPSAEGRHRLEALVQRMGLTVVQGNRMGHLLGPGISKGKALATLKRHLGAEQVQVLALGCLLYTSPSPRDVEESRMPSSA